MASYTSYVHNLYKMYQTKKEFKEVLGPLKRYLVDRDQDTSLVLGQGTRAGLYQSIM